MGRSGFRRLVASDHDEPPSPNVEPARRPSSVADISLIMAGQAASPGMAASILQLQEAAGNRAVAATVAPAVVQRASCCSACGQGEGTCAQAGESDPVAVQRSVGDGHDLSSPRFAGEERLEACFDDEARLTLGAVSPAVAKVQQGLIDLSYDLGPSGADGKYGQQTWNAVKTFKRTEKLGFTEMGDVGPGTMGRLDELFPGSPPGPVDAAVEPLVCAGADTEPDITAENEAAEVPIGDSAVMQRQIINPPPLGGPCPVLPFDFTGFTGTPPANTNLAAFTFTRLRLVQGSVVAEFVANRSWVNRRLVPVPPNRAPDDARVVANCTNAFRRPGTPSFTHTPSQSCPAVKHSATSFTATNAGQCASVIGSALDTDRQRDALGRLSTHEQYHMRLACAIAELADGLIAGGTRPADAMRRAEAANVRMQARPGDYDRDSDNGCNPTGQAAWERDIDGRNLRI